eukprot:2415430-Ditylum_brightwellii.AAC.1
MKITLQHQTITMLKMQTRPLMIVVSMIRNYQAREELQEVEENGNASKHSSVDEQDNGNDNTSTPNHNNVTDAYKTTNDHSFHDQELPDSTGNNTVLTPEELQEVEENENASNHNSVDEKVNANVPVTQKDPKDKLFGLSSSCDSSKNSEAVDGGKSGDSPEDPPSNDYVNTCGDAHEEPHGVAHGHAGGGIHEEPHGDAVVPNKDWKQRSTQVTMNSVRVKEESIIPQNITVPNR